MVLDRQEQVALNLPSARAYVRRLRAALRLGRRDFNVCFVDDRTIQGLNAAFRRKSRPTDVLAFPWQERGEGWGFLPVRPPVEGPRATGVRPNPHEPGEGVGKDVPQAEFASFLGDVVISVETARRNARTEGHSTQNEIRWLILHGLLHLLGYDHETDQGEMTSLELLLRSQLGIAGRSSRRRVRPRSTFKALSP